MSLESRSASTTANQFGGRLATALVAGLLVARWLIRNQANLEKKSHKLPQTATKTGGAGSVGDWE